MRLVAGQMPFLMRRGYAQVAHAYKGKEREDDQPSYHGNGDDYRFPSRGRSGGAPDPYEVLGLDRSATEQQIKQQCKYSSTWLRSVYRLAKIVHPDSTHQASSPQNFSTLHKAYSLLSQPGSRSMYLQTGYGWDKAQSYSDAQMRAEINRRRRPRRSEAGAGAWGGFRGDGRWEPYEDVGYAATTSGEERYMSNRRFVLLMGVITGVGAWIQYHRLEMARESHLELLDRQHTGASQALAEARTEAALYGRERRERIRRRVRERVVIEEVERQATEGTVDSKG